MIGRLAEKQHIRPVSSQLHSISVCWNLNNNNRSDIFVANSETDNLGTLLRTGNAMFDIERMYWIDTDTHPQYFITCSINKDDQLDIISANSKSNSISVIKWDTATEHLKNK